MKVAIVSDYLPGYHKIWSGAEIVAVTLADMVKSRGCEPFFITVPFDYSTGSNGYRVLPVRTPLKKLGTISRNFPIDIGAIKNVYRKLKDEKPDIVHINAKYLFLPTMIACRLLKIPALFTVPDYFILCPSTSLKMPDNTICQKSQGSHCFECISVLSSGSSDSVEGTLHSLIKKVPKLLLQIPFYLRTREFNYFINRVDAFVVLSKSSKQRLVAYGIPQEKVEQIYHYKLNTPRPTDVKIESPSVFFAGKFCRENGTDLLVDAFSETLKQGVNAKLYLVGWPEESFRNELEEKIDVLGLRDRIVLLGKRENAEILSLISNSDIVVVPHQWPKEFGPVILIEAIALCKPVITSRIGGTDEFVSNGENGFLIENIRDPKAFSEKMTYLLSNPSKAREMGEKGKDRVSFLFGDDSANEMIDLYNKIVAGR